MPQFSLLLTSYHHPMMNSYYLFLLLLVVLSAYPKSPQHVYPSYSFPIAVAVYPKSSFAQLGVFAPVLPHYEVSINPPQYEVSNPPHYEVSIKQPQYEVYKIALPQNEVFETVLPQLEVFQIAPVNCLIE